MASLLRDPMGLISRVAARLTEPPACRLSTWQEYIKPRSVVGHRLSRVNHCKPADSLRGDTYTLVIGELFAVGHCGG